jgi:hypothetical protein
MPFIDLGRSNIWITAMKLYHWRVIQIANAILNHKQLIYKTKNRVLIY